MTRLTILTGENHNWIEKAFDAMGGIAFGGIHLPGGLYSPCGTISLKVCRNSPPNSIYKCRCFDILRGFSHTTSAHYKDTLFLINEVMEFLHSRTDISVVICTQNIDTIRAFVAATEDEDEDFLELRRFDAIREPEREVKMTREDFPELRRFNAIREREREREVKMTRKELVLFFNCNMEVR